MLEPVFALRWLANLLINDSELSDPDTGVLGGWHRIPHSPASPYGIVRQETSSVDLTGLDNAELIWVPVIVQINLYDRGRGDFSRIEPHARRVYELVHHAQGITADGVLFACERLSVRADAEVLGETEEQFIEQRFSMNVRGE